MQFNRTIVQNLNNIPNDKSELLSCKVKSKEQTLSSQLSVFMMIPEAHFAFLKL